jgi:hypothetical protein
VKTLLPRMWHVVLLFLVLACTLHSSHAQTSLSTTAALASGGATATASTSAVPPLVHFSGVAKEFDGAAASGTVGVTFAIYKEQQGGAPLWLETQNVQPDSSGEYSVLLGATKAEGLPTYLFASGEARWLGVQISGQAEQPRVLLLSVPYAMKAADADTVGGLPASAFLLAAPLSTSPTTANATTSGQPQPALTGVTPDVTPTGSGTAGYVPLWSTASNLGNSLVFQAANGFIGINNPSPITNLDLQGSALFRGSLTLPAGDTATVSSGHSSHSLTMAASSYSSTTKASESQTFEFIVEPLANNTATPSAALNLSFAAGSASQAPTGFSIAANGVVTFAPGQTFPGTSTITDVSAGSGLVGGGTTGTVTVNVDSTKVPLLANANTFAATQTINGDLNLPATTGPKVGVLNIGGVPFLHGYNQSSLGLINVFVGDAGNFTTSGVDNTGIGVQALAANTTGNYNTAVGQEALFNNSSGGGNTASGTQALLYSTTGALATAFGYGALRSNSTGSFNTGVGGNAGNIPDTSLGTGSYNTALGASASASTGTLSNTTAVGANAIVGQNNTLVLGNTTASPGAEFVNVGIGTETPRSAMEASVTASAALGPVLTLTNPLTTEKVSTGEAIDFNSWTSSSSGYNPSARIAAVDMGNYSEAIFFETNNPGAPNNGMQTSMIIGATGEVIVGNVASETEQAQMAIGADGPYAGLYVVGGANPEGNPSSPGGFFVGGNSGSAETGPGIMAMPGQIGGLIGNAGYFAGNVEVDGTVSAVSKDFKMDHPLDPGNKYLVHSSVESSEMMNIYTGNVVTDDSGVAKVGLPDWFESLNTDFRYQLTVVGQFAQAIIAKKIANKQFTIRTSVPNVEVSWQVTAVRQDAYAKAHPLVVEQEKPLAKRGYYLTPEAFGQPREKQEAWAIYGESLQHALDSREKIRSAERVRANTVENQPAQGPPASAVNRTFVYPPIPVIKPSTPVRPAAVKPASTAKP